MKQPSKKIINPVKSCLLILALLLGFSSCRPTYDLRKHERGQEMDAAFYNEYSQKLGFRLSGKENPSLIREVARWTGTPYRYGGTTPAGADCSGFVWKVYRDVFDIELERTTRSMAKETRRVGRSRLQEGDLVFFRTKGRKISHVGIYLGNNHFIHASSSRGVIVSNLDEAYYSQRFHKGGRVRK